MEGLGPDLDRRKRVISFLPNPDSCLAMTSAGPKAQSLLQGASGISAKGQTQVDIFDLKPQLTAPAGSEVLRGVKGLEECQVLLALLLHHHLGIQGKICNVCTSEGNWVCPGPSLGLVVGS